MQLRRLDKIFRPERVAVIGASRRPESLGGTVLRNLIGGGFEGVVYPVNPNREAIHGILTFPDVASLPHVPDLAVVCVHCDLVLQIVRECGEAGVGGLIIFSSGFSETGEAGLALERRVHEELKRFPGMRAVGPNCLGLIVPSLGLNASFAGAVPKSGAIAFISQSGPLCASVLDWALQHDVGFSFFVSAGNATDVTIGDLIDYAGQDERTSSIILYLESITDARKFMSASRAFARTKPIVAFKAGRFPESEKAALAHTGAMAADDAVYNAAFARAGVIRIYDVGDMFECAELLGRHRLPRGARLAIVTNAGGPGVMATDALMERGGVMAEFTGETTGKLQKALPPFASCGNPVDLLCDATPQRFAEATGAVLADPGVDAALVVLTPQRLNATEVAVAVADVAQRTRKPVLAAWMGADSVAEGSQFLGRAGVPTYSSPDRAVTAFSRLVSYARNVELLYETPREIPVSFALDRDALRARVAPLLHRGDPALSETDSMAFLEAYGIPTAKPEPARTGEEAVHAAQRRGYPVVLKLDSPDIVHRSDVGGVSLNLTNDDEVRAAFDHLLETAAAQRPGATINGVVVEPMFDTTEGVELILGAKKDRVFGSVIMVGTGGVEAEVLGDRVLGLPPLNERLARRMLEKCKCWPLLTGFRGRPPVNIDRLIETLMRLSYLVADFPEVVELDVNPLLVTPRDVIALDALMVVDPEASAPPDAPFAHLAIPPYPEQYTNTVALRDGTPLLLRAIKPEDEPMWHGFLAACSAESIRGRFHSMFHGATHAMAARACCIDYDREIAIVAEVEQSGERRIIGVAQLAADPDLDEGDFAILVADPWQGKGLGRLLTEDCLRIGEEWKLNRVTAITSATNPRMIKIFAALGFTIARQPDDDVVEVDKTLATSVGA